MAALMMYAKFTFVAYNLVFVWELYHWYYLGIIGKLPLNQHTTCTLFVVYFGRQF